MSKTEAELQRELQLELQLKLQRELADLKELERYKEGLPHIFGQKFYPWARRVWDSTNPEIFLCSANQVGKDIHKDCLIPTPSGLTRMGDLKVGDTVFGRDGNQTKIIAIPFESDTSPLYTITFNNNRSILAGPDHEWICKGYEERFRKTSKRFGTWVVKSTRDIISLGKYQPHTTAERRFSIPAPEPVEMPNADLFDPYFVGLWLGNGSPEAICFHGDDDDLRDYATKYGNLRKSVGRHQHTLGVRREVQRLLPASRLSSEKIIPEPYLLSSIAERRALLAGLMDTDGSCERDGTRQTFCTTSQELSKSFERLVASLGGLSQTRQKPAGYKDGEGNYKSCNDAFETTVWLNFNPFRSKRKSSKWRPLTRDAHELVIKSIELSDVTGSRCITVDNQDGSFLATSTHVVTHNSSIAIRKNIRLATDPTLWLKYWPNLLPNQKPNLFWYMLPTLPVAQVEYETKWEPYWLPQGEFKDHPVFGWRSEFEKGMISKIKFNSGVTIQFKAYSMKVKDLQTATVYHVTADEELPVEYYPEVKARLNASDGHFLMVFTATLGQVYWQQTMEPQTKSEERHKDALKLQVSLFDSQWFDDGKPSHWTKQKIQRAIANCPTDAEIQRRVYGRFVKATGLLYEAFSVGKNMAAPSEIPSGWSIWSGVDVGSGGQSGHPAAIIFVAVSEDFKRGRVFRAWRGDGIPTTATDICTKYRELKKGLTLTHQAYDFASADFFTVASRLGESFSPANKRREAGVGLINALFKCGILSIERDDPELEKLVQELTSLSVHDNKRKTTDDLSDALRYAVMAVPWNFEGFETATSIEESLAQQKKPIPQKTDGEQRREWFMKGLDHEADDVQDEFDFWNDLSGA